MRITKDELSEIEDAVAGGCLCPACCNISLVRRAFADLLDLLEKEKARTSSEGRPFYACQEYHPCGCDSK